MKWLGLLGVGAVLSLVVGVIERPASREGVELEVGEVSRGELTVRTAHTGRLASRKVVPVVSRLQGAATILELTEEGTRVEEGDLLVEFDTAEHEREVLQFRTEVTVAAAELEELAEARQPKEIMELGNEISATERALASETQYLEVSRDLVDDHLVSAAEVARQEGEVEGLRQRLAALEGELELIRAHRHPMELRRARARLEIAREELARARRQVEHGRLVSAAAGVVVHQPLHIAGEFRTVRVGDSVYANQPFLKVLDFSDLVVEIAVPESELRMVGEGDPALIQPSAFPEVRLRGEVERVSRVAQTLPDKPSWQRFFRATVVVRETHDLLRPGMSVVAQVISHHRADALKIPRRAVRFVDDVATAQVLEGSEVVTAELRLGHAGETHFEVLEGVEEGDRVVLR